MIERIEGKICNIDENNVTISVSGIGIKCFVSHPEKMTINTTKNLITYMHWNADSGPTIYGFETQEERILFLLIIDCPKIGPKNALAILSNLSCSQFVSAINSQNYGALSSVPGVGEKKAEQIITTLKYKISKLLSSGEIKVDNNSVDFVNLSEALISLGYSKQEVSSAVQQIGKSQATEASFDQMLRMALSILSGGSRPAQK